MADQQSFMMSQGSVALNQMGFPQATPAQLLSQSPPFIGLESHGNQNQITLREIYNLLLDTRTEFRNSLQNIQQQVTNLSQHVGNMGVRITDCEERLARVEDNYDEKFAEHEHIMNQLMSKEESFPVETTVVCTGLQQHQREDIHAKSQEMVEKGLGLEGMRVIRAMRMQSRTAKPGLVKICFSSKDDKIAALRNKRRLTENGYRGVFIRSSLSHTDRVIQQNMISLLRELPNGDNFRITAHGKLVKKTGREGIPPQDPGIRNNGQDISDPLSNVSQHAGTAPPLTH